MARSLTDPSPGALTEAIEWNMFGLYAAFGRIPHARVELYPDMMRLITGLPHELLNGIFRAQLPEHDVGARIEDALADFRSAGLPMIWWTGPSTVPPHLGKHLEAYGLVHAGDLTGMAVDLADWDGGLPVPPELEIEAVRDVGSLRDWMAPLAFGFELPEAAALALFDLFLGYGFDTDSPFRHYLGRWKGHPVATSSLFMGAGVAGAYVTVVPDYRKQGIGAAMTAAPLRDARASGYRVAVTQASNSGGGFHSRLGFKAYCTLGLYMPTAHVH